MVHARIKILVRDDPLGSSMISMPPPFKLLSSQHCWTVRWNIGKDAVVRQNHTGQPGWTPPVALNCLNLTWSIAAVFCASYGTPQQGDTTALRLDGIAKLLLPCVGRCGKQHADTHQQVQICSLRTATSAGMMPTSAHRVGWGGWRLGGRGGGGGG